MAGGRPSQGKQQRYPELEELAAWFKQALTDAGYRSVNEFLELRLFEKNALYGVFGAKKLLTLDSTKSLAVALKRSPAQVEPVWIRAKEAMDRTTAEQRRSEEPRVASWPEIQWPSLALRNLLEAQTKSVDRLPYELLAVHEPPLSTVYVSPRIQTRTSDERTKQDDSSDGESLVNELATSRRTQAVTSISDALDNHDHLLVTGEPGAGKSTMSSYLARQLSRLWLREDTLVDPPVAEPLVPLRVAARSLVGSGSWSSVLAKAASRSFGRSLLEDPDPGLFAGRVHGARWLVMVDGLDEIPDPRLRGEVIWTIGQHARVDSIYRFVVTTRALPDSELAPLTVSAVGSYVIQPFDRPQLEEFAGKWFGAQQVSSAAAETERFLRETADGRLRDLVRNPLLATIAAVSAVKEPERPLPASRISLYERFCSYLSSDRSSRRDPLDQLHKQLEHDPERLGCVRWLHRSRSSLLGVLARRRLESQDKLWNAAVEWVRESVPDDVELVEGWAEHLWEELAGNGLLVADDRELVFLHQSFAEFLAAQSHAEAIGDDPADLDAWIYKGLREADRTFALFTFATWAGLPGRSIDVVLERLLASFDPRRIFLAGRLLAEGIAVKDAMTERVLDRLFALVRCGTKEEATEGFEVLGALFDHPAAASRLTALATDIEIPAFRRSLAVGALERLEGGAHPESLLAEILPSAYYNTLYSCARIAARLGPSAVEAVRHRTIHMIAEPDSTQEEQAIAAEVFRILGMAGDVADMACRVMTNDRSDASDLRLVAQAWIAVDLERAVPEIARLAADRPVNDHAGRVALAGVLVKAGAGKRAEPLAEAALRQQDADADVVVDAAGILLSARGADAVAVVLDAVDRWSRGNKRQRLWYSAELLGHLAPYPEAGVVSQVKAVLSEWQPGGLGAHNFVEAWLAADRDTESVMRLIDRGAVMSAYDRSWTAQHLLEAGAKAAAAELAASTCAQPMWENRSVYKRAMEVLLEADRAAALALPADLDSGFERIAGVMDALTEPDPDVSAERARCAHKLVAFDRVDGVQLRDALQVLLHVEGQAALAGFADAVITRPELRFSQRRQLVRMLAAADQWELARSLWAQLLEWPEYTVPEETDLIEELLTAGMGEWAAERIRELLDRPGTPARRVLRLKRHLAWLTTT